MKPITPRTALVLAILLVAAHLLALGILAHVGSWTPDEKGYLLSGRNLLAGASWEVPEQRFQGPLGLLANQTFVDGDSVDPLDLDPWRLRARLGMLVFPLLLMLVVFAWAREAWGRGGAVLALFLTATNPTLLAYGPLLAIDVALTATATATFWLTWRWLRRPTGGALAAMGVALGAMLATKYTSLLLVLAVPIATAVAVARGADPTPGFARRDDAGLARRTLGAVTALVGAGAIALLVLHACYLFRAPLYDPAQVTGLTSGALRAVAAVPGGSLLLGLLPDPFVLGADYQATVARDFSGTFLDVDDSHWAYYPASLLTKTPLGTLGLWALAMLAPAVSGPRAPRFTGLCLGTPTLVLLVYLSVASALQMGIRYLLPLIPLLIVRTGGWPRSRWAGTGWGKTITALACASSLAAAVFAWPHHIGYFNCTVGGSAGGYRLFADGNCDWHQRYVAGLEALEERRPGLERLWSGDDPRFGTIAAYTADLKPSDPERPGRTWHWITRFPIVDHDSAAWLVFEVTPEGFERAARQGEGRAARELALAWLREHRFDQAREALALAPDDDRVAALRELVDRAEAAVGGDRAARGEVVSRLGSSGHPELALVFLDDAARDELPELFVRMVQSGRLTEAVDVLRARADNGLRPIEVLLLAAGTFWKGDPVGALAVMDQGPAPLAGDPLLPVFENFHEEVRKGALAVEKLMGRDPPRDR